MFRFTLLLALTASLCACAGAGLPPLAKGQVARPTPAVVTDASYAEVLRSLQRLDAQDSARTTLRERLAEYLLHKGDDAIGADHYDEVVSRFGQVTELYSPNELAARGFPDGLSRLAKYLVAKGSPRGDEARVLSALLILKLQNPDDATQAERYEKLVLWGFDARADMSGPLERFEGLIEAWEEHARLSPLPEVQKKLVQLYVERRDALVKLFQSSDGQVPLSQSVFQGVQRTALSVAAVYLRQGDTASALTQVKSLGASAGIEQRLAEILASTREDGSEGAGALLDLSRAYLEGGRPDVARALCLSGLRGHRDDARFPQCLARICATENDYGGALAWYADAIALVPEERALYDEILEVLKGLIEEGPLTTDVANTHLLATRATEILRERMRRWPKSPPPVAPEELYNAIGEAQMNAGDTAAAERSFGESLAARQTVPTSLQLGLLLERKGRAQQAVAIYTKALETVSGQAPDAARQRAELLERLGDAQRNSGHRPESVHAYEQALAAWAQIVPGLHGRVAGVAELRRGVVLGRLGRNDDAKAAFERAIDAAPGMRETYATILAFLVVHSPDSAFAHEVFHRAQNQVGLATEWKVYFALWLRMIAGRSGQSGDADASEVFESFESGHDWPAKLSGFGSGKLSYDALLAQTSGPGEQAEAHFYEGARRLALGDYAGAQAMFSQVLDTGMVAFYEFAMAQELLAQPAPEPVPAVVAKPTK